MTIEGVIDGMFFWLFGSDGSGFYCMMVYTEQAREFELEKGCSYERMKEIAVAKGLTDWDIQLLKGRYCDGLSWRGMCDAFVNVGSESTIKRYVSAAVRKFEEA